MKQFKRYIFILSLMFIGMNACAEIAIIVHLQNTVKLNKTDISQLFLGQVSSFPNGAIAIPVALSRDNNSREIFNETVLNKTENQYKAFWSRLVFTGKASPPSEFKDSSQLRDLVSKNPAFIGYIDSRRINDTVKVIATF